MATSSINMNRITGLATGLDTDSLIKQLMQAEKAPLNKLVQKKQILQWQKETYRDITNLIRGFQDDFFNLTKPATNMTSKNAFYKYSAAISDTSIVSATATAEAGAGIHTLKVSKLATAASVSGTSVAAPLTGSGAVNLDYTTGGNEFKITVDGVTKTIGLRTDTAYGSYSELAADLQQKLNSAFGTGKISATIDDGTGLLTFNSGTGSNKIILGSGGEKDALGSLKFASGATNKLNLSDTLENLATKLVPNLTFEDDQVKFSINGVDFAFSKETKLKDMMTQINNSKAGVELTFSELTDSFTLKSKTTGASDGIVITNTAGNLFGANSASSALGIAVGTVNGEEAVFELDGVAGITRSTNKFTIDGVTYTLNSADSTKTVTINLSQNVDEVYNNIKSFVDKYNEMIDKINGLVSEKKNLSIKPLTDDQREELSEKEIETWETKAKTGILRRDSILEGFVNNMRKALSETITGVSGTLKQIGISTGAYENKGKLFIDETKLKDAIAKNPDQVSELFTRTSSIDYSPDLSAEDRAARYKEEGFAQRLYDIIRDNIRTTRDKNGNKGLLVEKAGFVGDITEFTNLLDKEINNTNTKIDEMNVKLYTKENYYYSKFAALETAISKMNTQSSWLTQQFSSGS